MLVTGISKTAKVVIVLSVLLTAILAGNLWAREEKGKGDRSQNSQQAQKNDKSPRQNRVESSAPKTTPQQRETQKDAAPVRTPQIQIPTETARRVDVPIQQPKINEMPKKPQSFVPAPTGKIDQRPKVYRVPTTPSGVEVKRMSDINPPSQRQVITPITNKTPKISRDTGNSTTVSVSQRDRHQTIDSGKTSRITRPIEKLAVTTPSQIDTGPKSDRGVDTDKKGAIQQPVKEIRTPVNDNKTPVHKDKMKSDAPIIRQGPGQQPSEKIDRKDKNSIGSGDHDKLRIERRETNSGSVKERQHFDKNRADNPANRKELITSHRSTVLIGKGDHDIKRFRPASTRKVIYEDHSALDSRRYHHDYTYRDLHHRFSHRIIWPSFWYPVCYDWGHNVSVHYVYPYYHRRYVFVSLGGFWPDYSCVRYYWYPSHSFVWYGYDPVAQEISSDTYNYYTYNYYTTQPTAAGDYSSVDTTGITPVNADTFADVREKLSRQQPPAPDATTSADTLFDEGVKSFEQGSFTEAEEKFAKAMALAPNDLILPFAYAQTLFAQGKYTQTVEILRLALQKSSPDKQGVYFPRGLYLDENTLMDQIDRLADQTKNQPDDSNLQLLLGYQWLGIGETDKSLELLNKAAVDPTNSAAAGTLLDLAEKIKAGETQ